MIEINVEFLYDNMSIKDFIKEFKNFTDSEVFEKEAFFIDSLKLEKNKMHLVLKKVKE